jgi:uncharacterized protein (DUF2384 family)
MQKKASKKTRRAAGVLKGRAKKTAIRGLKASVLTHRAEVGPIRGKPTMMRYLDPTGGVAIDRVTAELGMSKKRLAETFGIAPVTLQRKARADAPKTQARLREGLEIVNRVSTWAGGPVQAMAWYRAEPIPAFGGRTAESLVKDGKAAAVRDYLDRVALGGFA